MNKKQYIVFLGLTLTISTMGYAVNPATKEYVDAQVTILRSQIAAIPSGTQGPAGPMGSQGPHGLPGLGVATGGVTGQILAKASNADYDTEWVNGTVTYTIGQQAMGGVVFYVDSTGQHGLIAAVADCNGQSTVRWGISQETGAFGNGIFSGKENNSLMIARQMVGDITGGVLVPDTDNSAALVCINYSVQADGVTPCFVPATSGASCYGGWYLPSNFELNQLYLQKVAGTVIGFANNAYWSSTESESTQAYAQDFATGFVPPPIVKTSPSRVRCIRAF